LSANFSVNVFQFPELSLNLISDVKYKFCHGFDVLPKSIDIFKGSLELLIGDNDAPLKSTAYLSLTSLV
jgi:hypothetical protein